MYHLLYITSRSSNVMVYCPCVLATVCQAMFTAVRTNDITKSGVLTFDKVLVNKGMNFASPYFRAPCDGIYQFDVNLEHKDSYKGVILDVRHNNNVVMRRQIANQKDCDGQMFKLSINLYLKSKDMVSLYVNVSSWDKLGGRYHMFSGKLIQQD